MKKLVTALIAALLLMSVLSSCNGSKSNEPTPTPPFAKTDAALIDANSTNVQLQGPQPGDDIAVISTSKGDIKIRLFTSLTPLAVENFSSLASSGYYNNCIFHRVRSNFMIQSGDPLGTGSGGQSMWGEPFEREIVPELHHIRGALAMARPLLPEDQGAEIDLSAKCQNSQFYIVQGNEMAEDQKNQLDYFANNQSELTGDGSEYTWGDLFPHEVIDKYLEIGGSMSLDYSYTVFGQVYEGIEIVDQIATVKTNANDKPEEDILILSITISKYK